MFGYCHRSSICLSMSVMRLHCGQKAEFFWQSTSAGTSKMGIMCQKIAIITGVPGWHGRAK